MKARKQAALAISRRSENPTAIGRMPPSFLLKACSVAPKHRGLIQDGTDPDETRLMNSARVRREFRQCAHLSCERDAEEKFHRSRLLCLFQAERTTFLGIFD
jgi:hypothetical protein